MVTSLKSPLLPVLMQWGNSSEGVRELRPGDQCWAQNLNSSDVFETAGHVAFDLVTLGVEKLTMSLVGYRFATMTLLAVDEVVSVNVAELGAKNSQKDTTLRLIQEFARPNRKRKRQNREPAAKTKAAKKSLQQGAKGTALTTRVLVNIRVQLQAVAPAVRHQLLRLILYHLRQIHLLWVLHCPSCPMRSHPATSNLRSQKQRQSMTSSFQRQIAKLATATTISSAGSRACTRAQIKRRCRVIAGFINVRLP